MNELPVDLDAYIDAGTALLGIAVQPEWRPAIRLHLGISFNLGQLVLNFPLLDEADPAPVFAA
jgi:1-carboxybiuret hydrolase subunit AtzG-like protein